MLNVFSSFFEIDSFIEKQQKKSHRTPNIAQWLLAPSWNTHKKVKWKEKTSINVTLWKK